MVADETTERLSNVSLCLGSFKYGFVIKSEFFFTGSLYTYCNTEQRNFIRRHTVSTTVYAFSAKTI